MKEVLEEIADYHNKGADKGFYELKAEYKKKWVNIKIICQGSRILVQADQQSPRISKRRAQISILGFPALWILYFHEYRVLWIIPTQPVRSLCQFVHYSWNPSIRVLWLFHHSLAFSCYRILFRSSRIHSKFPRFALKNTVDLNSLSSDLLLRILHPRVLNIPTFSSSWSHLWNNVHLSIPKGLIFKQFAEWPGSRLFEFFTLIRTVKRSHLKGRRHPLHYPM